MSQTSRQIAVRTLRAMQRIGVILETQADEWEDVDEYLRGQLWDIRDAVTKLQAEIDETYPGRRRKGCAS